MTPRPGLVMLGVLRLALLRAEGIDEFGTTPHAFLASLAPLVAFPVAGSVMAVLSGAGAEAVAALLGTLVALLAPPVLSEAMARRFDRAGEWLRYATAFNWTRWAMLMALAFGLLLMGVLDGAGLSEHAAFALGLLAVALYGMVLDWFVALVGLRLVWWRAVLVVLAVNGGSALLFLAPRLLAVLQDGGGT